MRASDGPGYALDAEMTSVPSTELKDAVTQFLYEEARCLDRGEFAAWLALFADDGLYWIPAARDQTDPLGVPSIAYEDVGILSMRVERLLEARALVLTPMPRTTRLVTNITVDVVDPLIHAAATFLIVEMQDGQRAIYAGHSHYELQQTADGFLIHLKRVDLMDCDGVHRPITIPL